MLYNLSWLQQNKPFPPRSEQSRIERYDQNAALFDGDHFDSSTFRHREGCCTSALEVYRKCSERISRVVGNFEDVISFPVLLNYQRLMSIKMADLVCGEPPTVSGSSPEENSLIKSARDYTMFDSKLYAAVMDMSKFGECIQRIYKDANGKYTFTNWEPREWYPIVSQDGTYTILKHCLCWIEDISEIETVKDLRLHVQIHGVETPGSYEHRVYKIDNSTSMIGRLESTETVRTGLKVCAVRQVKAYDVTGTVYGYDDYMPIDSILSEIMARLGQISVILDKHADPNITGPVSMLTQNSTTGEMYLKRGGKFYAVSPGEDQPKYMTWEGQLGPSFTQLEMLFNQLYIISEMGAALIGDSMSGSQSISGSSLRFKMAGPLSKARRITNALTLPVRKLYEVIASQHLEEDGPSGATTAQVKASNISVFWADGLPDDPRENIEMAKLATGETKMMPLDTAIMEYFRRSNEEAIEWMDKIRAEKEASISLVQQSQPPSGAQPQGDQGNPNKSGPQDGTGINPNKKGSETGLNNPTGQQNRNQDTNRSRQQTRTT